MRVVVHAQDLSGRRDDGYYTKPDLPSALDIFFERVPAENFLDDAAEHTLSREDAEAMFNQDSKVSFYNADGEKVIITHDPSQSD